MFKNEIVVNTTALGTTPLYDTHTFCTQMINSTLHSIIGTETICTLYKDPFNNYVFSMDFSPDATFGSTQPTTLKLKDYFRTNNNCTIGIPVSYNILSLPIDKPFIIFRYTSTDVTKCADKFILDIFASKGLTSRNPTSIIWTVESIDSVTSSALKTSLNSTVYTSFNGKKYVELNQTTVSSLEGKLVEFKVSVTNFLGKTSTKNILISFLSTKKIVLEGLYSSYSLYDNQDQKLFLSAKIPYCTGDDKVSIYTQEQSIVTTCILYQDDETTLVSALTDCKIPAGTMSYSNTYKLKITAQNPSNSSMDIEEWATINIALTDYAVFINGGDRSISVNNSYSFSASISPMSSNLKYKWSCIDAMSNTY